MSSKEDAPVLTPEQQRAKRLHRLADACLVVIMYGLIASFFCGLISLGTLEKPSATSPNGSGFPPSLGPPLGITSGACLLLVVACIFAFRRMRRSANKVITQDALKALTNPDSDEATG